VKLTDQVARHEIAGHEFAGHKNARHEIAGHEIARQKIEDALFRGYILNMQHYDALCIKDCLLKKRQHSAA